MDGNNYHIEKLVFVFTIIFALIIHDVAQAQSRKAKHLKRDYLQVAFGEANGIKQPLTKWEDIGTIRYYIEGDMKYLSEKKWNKFLIGVETLSHLKFKRTNDRSNAQILIYFGALKKYFKLTKTNINNVLTSRLSNWSSRRWNAKRQLVWAGYCIVPSQIRNSKVGSYYVQNLFLKSLGVLGVSDNEYSIYYKYFKSRNYRLRRSDKRLLKLHYNDKIKAGMKVKEVKGVLADKIDLEKLAGEKL